MIGNVFICLDEQTYKGLIPVELQGSYARKTYDENGNLLAILETTFEEVGIDNRRKFGGVIEIDVNGAKHFVMEFNASWLSSEVSALISLGAGLNYPSNTLLTNKEAIELINLHQLDLEADA
jgi:hypothetical protein